MLTPSDQINAVISDTHIFGPRLINELRLGANHRKESRTPPGLNENWGQKLDIPGISPESFPGFFNSGGGNFYRLLPRRLVLSGYAELHAPGQRDLYAARAYFQDGVGAAADAG